VGKKNKLQRFAEMATFANVVQPSLDEINNKDYSLKGKWSSGFFKNEKPIVLELGCGKGEYTLGLSKKHPDKNFIGVDIKGARIWAGAKEALRDSLTNVGFLRTRIEHINSLFEKDEISEIWITFPDPQEKRIRAKKRLTSSRFLPSYRTFLKPGGIIHLKTDNSILYDYTHRLAVHNNFNILANTSDLYNSGQANDILEIKTFYESQYLAQGIPIKYICFTIPHLNDISEPPEDEEGES
jgi:tRNA (guanine-N7-)-methyltransferase